MSDIFREIDEEMRRERMGEIWKKYGSLIVAFALLIVLGTAAWRGYEYWRSLQAQQAGARYEKAMELARDGKPDEAEKAFAAIAGDAPGGYRILARMRAASETAKTDPDAGVTAWRAIAADSGVGAVSQDMARLRIGYLLVDKTPYADFAKEIEGLAQVGNPWRNAARELLAVSALKANETASAAKWLDQIVAVWAVRKPTKDGHVTSLEAFDANNKLIIQFFGKRQEGSDERAAWRSLVEGLPHLNQSNAA